MYPDVFRCIQMYSNVSVQMELLTFGSVPISRQVERHMEGGGGLVGKAIVLAMGFLCPSNPQSKHYASKHAQTQFSPSQTHKRIGFPQYQPRNRLHIIEYILKSRSRPFTSGNTFSKLCPNMGEGAFVWEKAATLGLCPLPVLFFANNFKALAHWRKGFIFRIESLQSTLFMEQLYAGSSVLVNHQWYNLWVQKNFYLF